ncbi:MAG: beta-ketoacyl-[acyl-carrier-protein] synthase family protein [Prevotellaceae bacterium]|nr:beta-ketoacyl-[acyl-carrier-protein] synthase family protein [Prevotellaceae bacterium]
MARRVFITGFGIISAIGNGVEETLASLTERKSGIGQVSFLKTSLSCFPVAEIRTDSDGLARLAGIPLSPVHSRTFLLGLIAAREAVRMSGCEGLCSSMGMIGSTTVAGIDQSDRYYRNLLCGEATHKDKIPSFECADSTELIADFFGITHHVTTISTACSSSANAIMNGARMIKCGVADRMLVGGSDSLSRFSMNGFNALEILSPTGCRPFDNDRNGITPGEGAAFLVLEAEEMVGSRTVYGEVSGYSNCNEAFHQTASLPDGTGAFLSISKALQSASIEASEIDYVNAHGTGTKVNDLSEGRALKTVFGKEMPLFSSTKGYTGHPFAAAGAMEAVFSLLSINHGLVFPNLAFETKMEEVDVVPVTQLCRRPIRRVLSNSFGFGGTDTTLIFSKV